MELRELLVALHEEMAAAGVSAEASSASLAFVARKNRDGAVALEFADAAAMSKPRPEELHRLEISLTGSASSIFKVVTDEEDPGADPPAGGLSKEGDKLDSPPAFRHVAGTPPNLPSRKR